MTSILEYSTYKLEDHQIRRWVPWSVIIGLLLCWLAGQVRAADTLSTHHQLQVQLQPPLLQVSDRMTLDPVRSSEVIEVVLGSAFEISQLDAELISSQRLPERPLRLYRLKLRPGQQYLNLRYSGRLSTPVAAANGAMPALVYADDGVYLNGNSGWYPRQPGRLLRFSLAVSHPPHWRVISQGRSRHNGAGHTVWATEVPQDDIYLLAGAYQRYQRSGPVAAAEVYLRSDDPALADRYLDATERYLALYSELLGRYPFEKFALVENDWQTGWGMPSFTLLGSRVIRLPFILTSSFPHEIVHNWWGNSVYPDYRSGNWSEGLTSYLADHLLQEQQGRGWQYRRAVLQKYADYVSAEKDFPLRAFRARHNGASQAVGYGKTLMFFHMLRRHLGDADFVAALRRMYQQLQFQVAGFEHWQQVFEASSGASLQDFFEQWLERSGAPQLALEGVQVVAREAGGYRLSGHLAQLQPGPGYRLEVPVALTLQGQSAAQMRQLKMTAKHLHFVIDVDSLPLRIDIDPRYDLFRQLSAAELPPSLGQVFGADQLTLVLPQAASIGLRGAYQQIARQWQQRFPQLTVISDAQPLPESGGVLILGQGNRHADTVVERLQRRYQLPDPRTGGLSLVAQAVDIKQQDLVLSVRNGNRSTLAWISLAEPASAGALAGKLPHYGKYSFLAFQGPRASNVLKGEWPLLQSPLARVLVADQQVLTAVLPAERALDEPH